MAELPSSKADLSARWDDGKPLRDVGELLIASLRLHPVHHEPEIGPQPTDPSPPSERCTSRRVQALDRYLRSRMVKGLVRRSDVYWRCRQLMPNHDATAIRIWLLVYYIGMHGRTLVEVGNGKLRFSCPPPPRLARPTRRIRAKRRPFCWPPVS